MRSCFNFHRRSCKADLQTCKADLKSKHQVIEIRKVCHHEIRYLWLDCLANSFSSQRQSWGIGGLVRRRAGVLAWRWSQQLWNRLQVQAPPTEHSAWDSTPDWQCGNWLHFWFSGLVLCQALLSVKVFSLLNLWADIKINCCQHHSISFDFFFSSKINVHVTSGLGDGAQTLRPHSL